MLNYSSAKFVKVNYKAQKTVALFPEICWVKIFLSLTHLDSRMCIRIYIFNFKRQTNKQKKQEYKKKQKKLKKKREYLRKIK